MTDILKKEIITLSESKEILEKVKPDDMDQIQRWTYDYVVKFAKNDPKTAREKVKRLVEECELKEEEAVELINISPFWLYVLIVFTFGCKMFIIKDILKKMFKIIDSK